MKTIELYKHEIYNMLLSVSRIHELISQEDIKLAEKNNYRISYDCFGVLILDGVNIIKSINIDKLNYENIIIKVKI